MNKELINSLFKTKEGFIFLLALFITLSLLIFVIVYYFIDVGFANKVTGIIFTNLFIGRVPALSFGYAANLSHFSVISINVITEMMLVSYLYSLFVFSYGGVLKVKTLEKFFIKVEEKKEQHKERFEKYGIFGLFIFVFIPFWMTGPIVGSIIGFLIGMKHFTVIFTVLLATIISMTLWGLFLQEIIDFLVAFDTRLIWVVLALIVIVIISLKFRRRD